MTHQVVFTPEASEHLRSIRRYIRQSSGSYRIATNYVEGISAACRSLQMFPHRGSDRDGYGYRVIGYRDRVSIHFTVNDTTVTILAITYAGFDWQPSCSIEA